MALASHSSLKSSSTRSRSIFFGQSQSKSAIGLKLPSRARRSRRSSPRRVRSLLFPIDQAFEPRRLGDLVPVGEKAMELEGFGTFLEMIHGSVSSSVGS